MGLLDRLRGKPTPADFAAMLIRALRRAGETHELRHDPGESRILRLDGDTIVGVINLSNLYPTYLEKPRSERAEYLTVCVRSALAHARELPDEFEAARPDLRVKIWSRAGIEKAALRGRLDGMGDGPDLPSVPVGEHLVASVAYDWPDSTQSLSGEVLRGWGVTTYEALEAGRQNLEETTVAYARIGDGLVSFTSGDSYDGCRLLLIEKIQALGLRGRPIAIVPNRDTTLVAGKDDEVSLAILAQMAADGLDQNYRLSGVPLVLDGDAWTDWKPPVGHPLRREFLDLEARFLWPVYRDQKELLDALHEREGTAVFVAKFSAVQKEGGSLLTYCVWGEGVGALLPVAQKVVFMGEGDGGPVAIGDWDRVREVIADLMEETDHYPRRFRVRGFPDPEAIEAIGKGEL